MNKSLAVAVVVLAAMISLSAYQQPGPPSLAGKTAEQAYKNIQVLKGIPAEQVVPTMQFITAALGVDCEFCHVEHQMDKDDKKPKGVARNMIQMTAALNKNHFDGEREVTCYTCHHGSAHPASVPAVAEADLRPAHEQPDHDRDDVGGPTANEVAQKYIQALGGKAAIEKVKTRVETGTMSVGGQKVPIEIYTKAPAMRISISKMPNGESITAFDGTSGWLGMPRGTRDMNANDTEAAKLDAEWPFISDIHQIFPHLRAEFPDKIGEQEVYVILGLREGKPPVRLYFDQKTGLLVRMVRYGDTALGLMPTQIDYADYRDSGGVKIPYRWTLARPNGRFTIQVDEVKTNQPIEDSKFAKPDHSGTGAPKAQ